MASFVLRSSPALTSNSCERGLGLIRDRGREFDANLSRVDCLIGQ